MTHETRGATAEYTIANRESTFTAVCRSVSDY
jgi:hypothetical protein